MVGEQAEVAVGGDEGEDPLGFPPLEPDTRVEADVVQQPRILGDGGREAERLNVQVVKAGKLCCTLPKQTILLLCHTVSRGPFTTATQYDTFHWIA